MNTSRIKEIQTSTNLPNSVSVKNALMQVWNECDQDKDKRIDDLESIIIELDKTADNQHNYIKSIEAKCIHILKPVDCNECANCDLYCKECIHAVYNEDHFVQKECEHDWSYYNSNRQSRSCDICGLVQIAIWEDENAD